jgi:hypothetical protein
MENKLTKKEKDKIYRDANKEKAKAWREANKEILKEKAKAWRIQNSEKLKKINKEYKSANKEKLKIQSKEYYWSTKDKQKKYCEDNKEQVAKTKRDYYLKNKKALNDKRKINYSINKETIQAKRRIYTNEKYKTDSLFKLKVVTRNLIKKSLNRKGYLKSSKTNEILGCTYEDFKKYLESKFEPWMSWDNYGLYNGDFNYGWDVDHYMPLITAKSEADVIRLNHYTNLQPLCSHTNRDIKRDSLPDL